MQTTKQTKETGHTYVSTGQTYATRLAWTQTAIIDTLQRLDHITASTVTDIDLDDIRDMLREALAQGGSR